MNRFKLLILPGAAIVLLILAGGVLAQGSTEQLPPHVVDVQPYPGEEVPTGQAVTVIFDQPMDAASVESAWQMDPALPNLQFTWSDDRTLTLIPDGGWQRATRYQATIGIGARAANGLALEDAYRFVVQTIGYLEVSAVIPAPNAEGVAADATITVSFNRPVVPLVSTEQLYDLPRPLTFQPDIEGTGEWVNTSIYVFTPTKPLAGGTTYTANVPAGLTDVTGAVLEQTYSWQFKTLPPEILNVYPYNSQSQVLLDQQISVQFSQPMNTASAEEAFMVQHNGERVSGKIEWFDNDRTLNFTPDAPLEIESTYLITVAPTAQGASGETTIREGITYSFSTVPYPRIESTNPSNGEQNVSPGGGVSIYFVSPMNTDTFKDKVQIIAPEGVTWEPVVYGSSSLYLDFATVPETTYVITFLKGAQDIYGNAIESDYTFSFSTGKIEASAWLPMSNQFAITNAYREDTRLALSVTGKPAVDFKLYKFDTKDLGAVMRGYYYEEDIAALLQEGNLIRQWSQELDAGPTQYGVDEVLLASEQGGQLPLGSYYLEVSTSYYSFPQSIALGVVTANLTLKRSSSDALVWVTDIQSAEPVANTTVSVYRYDGSLIASGQTDADGIFRTPADSIYSGDNIYAVAQSEGVYGVWSSWYGPWESTTTGYLYTDRPIYRPGQTVYFRGVVRNRQDMTYSVPETTTVHVTIDVNYGAQTLLDTDLPLTEFGTFNGQIDLPEDAQIGQGEITAYYGDAYNSAQVSFTIAEFRVPEYKVDVTPDYNTIIQGDPVKSIAAASYYFGGPVSNAQLSWQAYGQVAYFNYTGPGYYSFSDDTQDYFSWVDVSDGSQATDASGQVIVDMTNTKAPSIRPMSITLEATVTDESGQYISGRTTILAHPANAYVGLRTDRYFGQEKEPITVDLIAVTPDSEPLADQKIELSVVEIKWERVPIEGQFGQYNWQETETEIETAEVRTGSDGKAQYIFTPPQAGIYRIHAQTRDEHERVNSSSWHLWVMGSTPVWWGRPSNTIDLIADQDSYQPGDTAEVLIPIPFSGISYVLITVERMGVQQYQVIRVDGSTLVYKLPITEEHVPTIFVSATLMKGMDEENLNPAYRTGTISLNVEPVNRRIQVTVTPSATKAQPGDTVTFDIKTVDSHGEPVSAEVGVGLTDQAILSLMPPNSGTMEATFYGPQWDAVYTDVALDALLDVMTDEALQEKARRENEMAGADAVYAAAPTATMEAASEMAPQGAVTGGALGAPPVQVREDFQQTPLWAPRVITDATGQGSVSVVLPDNLTTWHLDARGITVDTLVGDAALDIVSTLPLLTRPVTPRFFVVGDRVTLASVINNNTDSPQEVQATLQASGVTLEGDATQTVTIEAGQRARVEWVARVEDVPYVDLTFYAIGANGYQDASKPTLATGPDGTIPVYRYTAPDTVGTGGILREEGSRTEAISLPPRLDVDQGELTVHLDPSLAVTTVDALDYLRNYKHQCIEQTISRFLPNVVTYRALKQLGQDDPDLEAKLREALDFALTKLTNEQNPDGGWGWFGMMESDPYVTAYAVLGLVEARDAGFEVDSLMLDRAISFVRGYLVRPTIDTSVWDLNRQAFYLYVFARAGQVGQSDLDALLEYRLEMDLWARAFLLMAYHEYSPNDPAIQQLASDLQTAAIMSATGAHWEEAEMDWWDWSSDTRSTAIALAALTRVTPDSDLLPNVVRWLMVARNGDHWETTQETVWAVLALTDWMVSTGELKGNYTYALTLNGVKQTEGTVTPETVRQGEVLRIQVKDLLKDEANRLTFIRGAGDGVLYYTAHLNVQLWASEAPAISRGITVTREYFADGDPNRPINQAKLGDVITVRVTMTLPQDIYYFVLEDPLPAGTEAVDTSLLTTSAFAQAPSVAPTYDPRWWWGWWLFDRTAIRDEEIDLYADFLPRGSYVYTYQIRATIPGEFQTMPSYAYAFYFPEVFGRSKGTLFTVTE